MPLLHSRRAPSFHEPMIVCCFVYGEHQVWFILRCLVDREGQKRVIVFGLVDLVVLCRSRRPAKHDRDQYGLFCAARLIEKAGGV